MANGEKKKKTPRTNVNVPLFGETSMTPVIQMPLQLPDGMTPAAPRGTMMRPTVTVPERAYPIQTTPEQISPFQVRTEQYEKFRPEIVRQLVDETKIDEVYANKLYDDLVRRMAESKDVFQPGQISEMMRKSGQVYQAQDPAELKSKWLGIY